MPKSYLPEILKYAGNPNIISFAGGVPDQNLFPVMEIEQSVQKVLQASGKEILQYAPLEGDPELREIIANRYDERYAMKISPDDIMITTGAQQGLDLIGKIFLNPGDKVLVEEPGYLGAIQAFSFFSPIFMPVILKTTQGDEGPQMENLARALQEKPKLYYGATNFSNPTGITTSPVKREKMISLFQKWQTILIEDDAYGELGFQGYAEPPLKKMMPEQTVLLGSFSKSVIPSYRTGWIAAPQEIMEKLKTAKQAADLHTNYFTQRVMAQYLKDNDINEHLRRVRSEYEKRCNLMLKAIATYFPAGVKTTKPRGGMFIWADLPEQITGKQLFQEAINENVAIIPGDPFYTSQGEKPAIRLNFSAVNETTIEEGIKRIGKILDRLIGK